MILLIAGLLSLLMIIDLFNRNILVGFFFAVLQVYIYIPFAARCYDSALVDLVSHIFINDEDVLYKYLFFCYGQSIMLYLMFRVYVLRPVNALQNSRKHFWGMHYVHRSLFVYNLIQICVAAFLFYSLLRSFGSLNYRDQGVVKSNIIWAILLEYSFVFYLIDFLLYKRERRCIPLLLGVLIAIPAFVTLFKIGNRGVAMPALCGYVCMLLTAKNFKISIRQIRTIVMALFCMVAIIGFSQFVRTNRGTESNAHEFSLSMIEDFFDIKVLLFQDFTVPGNSLMYCIEHNIVNPVFVFLSNCGNSIFFLDYPTIALDISGRINTGVVFGVGGFLPVEGYYLCGYAGIIVLPIIIALFFRFYMKRLIAFDERQYNLFVGFLLCTFLCFNLARGQSYLLFKVLYMYVIPCCVLYRLALGYEKKHIIAHG